MWVRTQLKIGWGDLAAGAKACLMPPGRDLEKAKAEAYWPGPPETIAAYSVRSGFDLLLQALDLKPGDEVIFSALNVRGMVRIVKDAGLVAVPVDLDFARMGPSMERLKAAITPRSRVFVAAHLFGTRLDLDPLFQLVRATGIVAVEDCAQAFNGKAYPGSAAADLNLFSFGPIKTSTALGGALIRVRDQSLAQRMREIQAAYPVQPNAKHLKRIRQFMGLKIVTARPVLGALYRYFRARGKDYEDALADRVRDVAPLKSAKNLRFQPSAGMLALMNRRLAAFDPQSLERRSAKGGLLTSLINGATVLPAGEASHHDYWVYPIVADDPRAMIDGLRAHGFDAANLPRSQAVQAPDGRGELEPQIAVEALSRLVVVPCYDAMPDSEIRRQAEAIKGLLAKSGVGRSRALAEKSRALFGT